MMFFNRKRETGAKTRQIGRWSVTAIPNGYDTTIRMSDGEAYPDARFSDDLLGINGLDRSIRDADFIDFGDGYYMTTAETAELYNWLRQYGTVETPERVRGVRSDILDHGFTDVPAFHTVGDYGFRTWFIAPDLYVDVDAGDWTETFAFSDFVGMVCDAYAAGRDLALLGDRHAVPHDELAGMYAWLKANSIGPLPALAITRSKADHNRRASGKSRGRR